MSRAVIGRPPPVLACDWLILPARQLVQSVRGPQSKGGDIAPVMTEVELYRINQIFHRVFQKVIGSPIYYFVHSYLLIVKILESDQVIEKDGLIVSRD